MLGKNDRETTTVISGIGVVEEKSWESSSARSGYYRIGLTEMAPNCMSLKGWKQN